MRDTGWVITPGSCGAQATRTIEIDGWTDRARACVEESGEIGIGFDLVYSGRSAPDLAAAKRAAEDALRDLCRQTLAALGEDLVFGPWFAGERHAVAVDGARYSIMRLLNGGFDLREGAGWTYSVECATEGEAIAAANAHDLKRRGLAALGDES